MYFCDKNREKCKVHDQRLCLYLVKETIDNIESIALKFGNMQLFNDVRNLENFTVFIYQCFECIFFLRSVLYCICNFYHFYKLLFCSFENH